MSFNQFQRQHKHFGPNGFKPPTCGGPASGYVCCKVGAVSNEKNSYGSIVNLSN